MNSVKINIQGFLPVKKTAEQKAGELKKACEDFESVFTYQLLKSMRSTVDKCELFHGGQGEEIYQEMLDQELAGSMSGGGSNSIANMLYEQLKRNYPGLEEIDGINFVGRPANNTLPAWPVRGGISSWFGTRKDPFNGERRFHSGIDIAVEKGTHVTASMPGRVVRGEYHDTYGNLVVLDHGNGLTTRYAHNDEITVKTGEWVEKGSTIAKSGSTGRSTGPHLHFEVRKDGSPLDPADFFRT